MAILLPSWPILGHLVAILAHLGRDFAHLGASFAGFFRKFVATSGEGSKNCSQSPSGPSFFWFLEPPDNDFRHFARCVFFVFVCVGHLRWSFNCCSIFLSHTCSSPRGEPALLLRTCCVFFICVYDREMHLYIHTYSQMHVSACSRTYYSTSMCLCNFRTRQASANELFGSLLCIWGLVRHWCVWSALGTCVAYLEEDCVFFFLFFLYTFSM